MRQNAHHPTLNTQDDTMRQRDQEVQQQAVRSFDRLMHASIDKAIRVQGTRHRELELFPDSAMPAVHKSTLVPDHAQVTDEGTRKKGICSHYSACFSSTVHGF